ncbi:MAG TPA: hypothetical protein VGQ91_02385 [Ideonella sp.]|jgi:probable HAF family extracellular repeat protein|nr:hypothetical protein [Ideonella sp.]
MLRTTLLGILGGLVASASLAAAPQYRIKAVPEAKAMHPRVAQAINQQNVIAGEGVVEPADKTVAVFLAGHGSLKALPDTGHLQPTVRDLNKYGVAVGDINGEAVVWGTDGVAQNLSELIGCGGVATGVTDAGLVVGSFSCYDQQTNTLREASFSYRNGVLTQIGDFGENTTYINGINNARQMVGTYGSMRGHTSDAYHASIWQHGARTDLGTLGGQRSTGYAINELGHVVGTSDDASHGFFGFLHDGQAMRPLTSCPGLYAWPLALNRHDQIVGYFQLEDTTTRAFLIDQGLCYEVGDLLGDSGAGWTDLYALDINDAGVIVGAGRFEGRLRAFVAAPVKP